jgi:beta-lactamase regulating signal transducer with metallopeptidase domain
VIATGGLLGYAALLLAAAPLLARARWPERAPRLAIAVWLAVAASAIGSVVLAGLVLLVPAPTVSRGAARLLATCGTALRVRYAHPGGLPLAVAGAVVAVAVLAWVAWCAVATLAATARAGRDHRLRLLLAGRTDERLGALVVEHGEPAAYCMSGVRRPVVLTTAALRLLDEPQLAAVLAHERAHQAGRHHLLVSLAAVPAAAFPWVPAFRHTRDEVARLAELAADDAAARRSPRLAVAEALLTLGSVAGPAAAWALSAGGSTAAARVRRLIAAPQPLSWAAKTMWTVALAALIALPLVLMAAPAFGTVGKHPGFLHADGAWVRLWERPAAVSHLRLLGPHPR